MKLTNKNNVKLKEILLDPFNPRLTKNIYLTQAAIENHLRELGPTIDLMNSMKEGIKWVNRIVVRSIDTLTEDEKNKIPADEIRGKKFIVVEGNTRLACLKSNEIEGFIPNSDIPVLIAQKEDDESIENYYMELRITQGIANVMVVKEWSPEAKAKHIYELFSRKRMMNSELTTAQIIQSIKNEIGVSYPTVRYAIIRYCFFEQINKISDRIAEGDWGFLEVIEKKGKLQEYLGFDSDSFSFVWDDENAEINDTDMAKQELLSNFPKMIKSAKNENLNAKKFRDTLGPLTEKYPDFNRFKEKIDELFINGTDLTWNDLVLETDNKTDENIWHENLNHVYDKINRFPSSADWANDFKEQLEQIQRKINKHLQVLELDD